MKLLLDIVMAQFKCSENVVYNSYGKSIWLGPWS